MFAVLDLETTPKRDMVHVLLLVYATVLPVPVVMLHQSPPQPKPCTRANKRVDT